MDQGQGTAQQRRYYFNKYTKLCEHFDYRGADGNRNNFESLQQCQQQCPESPNPCAYGSSIPRTPCDGSEAVGNPCGSSQFCHVGPSQPTTVCCNRPPSGDQCSQALNTGLGNANLQRWYFDINSQQCEPFIYKGLQGNENNFLNQQDCEAACFVNPCAAGVPYRNQGTTVQCSPGITVCPNGYYCHIGADLKTTVCCPNLGGNACEQQMDRGEGKYQLQRWYWNVANQRCMPFVYGGLKGTQNNFLNQETCEKNCYVYENPCVSGSPQQGIRSRPLTCSLGQNICAATYWCHIGAVPQTTVCCPGKVEGAEICKLPLSIGSGSANLRRWYFDENTQICVPFTYGGMYGNQNNFPSQQQCQQICPGYTNPCASGNPQMNGQDRPVACSSLFNSCNPSYWCHIGAGPQTTLCCPGRVQGSAICQLSLSIGTGGSDLQRWYFDRNTQKCLPFRYGGLYGNQNNFLTKDQCEQACPVILNPCALGSPQLGANNRPQSCAQQNQCSSTYWCHVGAIPQTTICCPGRVEGYAICQESMTAGTGNASLQRWYYDINTRQCLPFTYRGMMGNQNNFLSKQQCQLACPVYVNVCPQGVPLLETNTNQPRHCYFGNNSCGPDYWCHLGLVPDEYECCPGEETNPAACQGLPYSMGVTGAPVPPATRWYYDKTTMTCKPFEYYGRKGNQNNFLTEADCSATCRVFVNPCSQSIALPPQSCSSSRPCATGSYCHYGLAPDTTICCPSEGNRCEQPMQIGTGNGSVQRWYYNSQLGVCKMFIYRGLRGNSNNFLSQQDCETACRPNPCADGQPYSISNGSYQSCDISLQINSCPNGYWCNPGGNAPTTVCCPGATSDPCNLPVITGEGTEDLERYYYDATTRMCREFTYRGMKGNQNNFLSLAACQQQCQPLENPCIGQPATTAAGQVLFCSATNKDMCPVNFWCHVGATPETTVCCPGATNPCSVPLSPGTGNANLSRWYYNADERECLPFQYNGRRGNQNNFESQAECARTCPEQLCLLSIDRGACNGRQIRYAFDRQQNQCISFEYTGCGGNLNNFHSLTDCISTCGQVGF